MFNHLIGVSVVKKSTSSDFIASLEFLGLFKSKEDRQKSKLEAVRKHTLESLHYGYPSSSVQEHIADLRKHQQTAEHYFAKIKQCIKGKKLDSQKFNTHEIPATSFYALYQEAGFKAIEEIPVYLHTAKSLLQLSTSPSNTEIISCEQKITDLNLDRFYDEFVVSVDGQDAHMGLRQNHSTYKKFHYTDTFVSQFLTKLPEIITGYTQFIALEKDMSVFCTKIRAECEKTDSIAVLKYLMKLHHGVIDIMIQKKNHVFGILM